MTVLDRVDAAPAMTVFTRQQTQGAIAVGVLALLMSGLMPLFLGALSDAHRLSAAGIGRLATLELLSTAVTTALAGAVLKPVRLRTIAVLACLLLVAANAATVGAGGLTLMAVRTLSGLPQGVLLWVVVSLIARTPTPERQAAKLFFAMAASQLAIAVAVSVVVLPRFGVDGAYALMAAVSALGVLAVFALPGALGPLSQEIESGAPPLKGLAALAAVFLFQAAVAGAGVYIAPLAHEAHLSEGVAQTAISMALALEVVGAGAATYLSGRVGYLLMFWLGLSGLLLCLIVYVTVAPAWLFVAASAAVGFFSLLIMPFAVPMTIRADPSRRSAVQIGGAQLLGGAVGPVLASMVVTAGDFHGVIALSAVLIVSCLALIVCLSRSNLG